MEIKCKPNHPCSHERPAWDIERAIEETTDEERSPTSSQCASPSNGCSDFRPIENDSDDDDDWSPGDPHPLHLFKGVDCTVSDERLLKEYVRMTGVPLGMMVDIVKTTKNVDIHYENVFKTVLKHHFHGCACLMRYYTDELGMCSMYTRADHLMSRDQFTKVYERYNRDRCMCSTFLGVQCTQPICKTPHHTFTMATNTDQE